MLLQTGHPALVIGYDHSPEQIFHQIASQRTGIDGRRIRQKQLTDKEKEHFYKACSQPLVHLSM